MTTAVREDASPFAAPPASPPPLSDCYFYHTTTIPGHGTIEGEWNLAPHTDAYLGHVSFAGRRVLDVGAATGFLSFHMESAGGDVVSYDLSSHEDWDIVPFAGLDTAAFARQRKAHIAKINNGYWLNHAARSSRAKMAYGTIYDLDPRLGIFDIGVFGSVLLHLRDPFRALEAVARTTRETIIVAEILPAPPFLSRWTRGLFAKSMQFRPRFRKQQPWETWWNLPPKLTVEFLGILGFEDTRVRFHAQLFRGRRMPMYTVVARRTQPRRAEGGQS